MKVFIMTPTYVGKDYCLEEFLEHCKKFTFPNIRHVFIDNSDESKGVPYQSRLKSFGLETYHVQRGETTRESLARAQNFARELFLKSDCQYFISLESDIFPPIDFIERMINSDHDVITGVYRIKVKATNEDVAKLPAHLKEKLNDPYNGDYSAYCITLLKYDEIRDQYGTELLKVENYDKFFSEKYWIVAAGGFGCCLVKRYVFEEKKLVFYYEPHYKGHSDIFFFNDCTRNKIPVVVDTTINCRHLYSDWSEVKDRGKVYDNDKR